MNFSSSIISARMTLWSSRRIWPVLLVSGALGFLCGALLQPTWQVVIEPSQVLAGVVAYPPDSTAAIFATRTWTILHQITALAIAAGVPERVLTILWSGVVGALSFQALALTTLAMGGTRSIASLSPLLIFVSGATRFLPGYPVEILGGPNTWSMVAHGWFLLLLALLALQRYRPAALLLGLFPSIHIAVGLWAWLIVGGLAVLWRTRWRGHIGAITRWGLVGLGVTLTSGIIHALWFSTPPPPAQEGLTELLRSLRLNWDSHRTPIDLLDIGAVAGIVLPAACVLWHRQLGRHLPPAAWWLTAGFATAAAMAVCADLAIRLLPEEAGAWLARPMPRRLLSLPLLGGVAWMIGLATGPRAPAMVRTASGVLFAVMAVVFLRPVGDLPVPSQFIRTITDTIIGDWATVATLLVCTAGVVLTLSGRVPASWHRRCDGRPVRLSQRALGAALTVLALFALLEVARDGRANIAGVQDRTNDPLLAMAGARSGLLLTAGDTQLVQAATRRPVLLDISMIDVLVYIPSAATIAERIAQQVYGITLTQPAAPGWGPTGRFPGFIGETAWTTRTVDEWRAIRAEFGVTDILTPPGWQLQLPRLITDVRHTLWAIPPLQR